MKPHVAVAVVWALAAVAHAAMLSLDPAEIDPAPGQMVDLYLSGPETDVIGVNLLLSTALEGPIFTDMAIPPPGPIMHFVIPPNDDYWISPDGHQLALPMAADPVVPVPITTPRLLATLVLDGTDVPAGWHAMDYPDSHILLDGSTALPMEGSMLLWVTPEPGN